MGLSQKALAQIEKFFLFGVPMNPSTDWKAKLERAHFLKVQSDRITVCIQLHTNLLQPFSNPICFGGQFSLISETYARFVTLVF